MPTSTGRRALVALTALALGMSVVVAAGARAAPTVAAQAGSSPRWELVSPRPDVDDRSIAWAVSPNEVWTYSTARGVFEQRLGGRVLTFPTGGEVRAMWGSSPRDVWAVGEFLWHWNGTRWARSARQPAKLLAVWGTSARSIWAVGAFGTILYQDGSGWSRQASGATTTLSHVWASSTSDLWTGGAALRRWDGTRWSTVADTGVYALWGSSPSNVYYATTGGLVQQRGSVRRVVSLPVDSFFRIRDIWGTSWSDVYVSTSNGYLLAGDATRMTVAYRNTDGAGALHQVTGSGSRRWVVGGTGLIVQRDAGRWQRLQPVGDVRYIGGGVGVTTGDYWYSQGDVVRHRTPTGSTSYAVAAGEMARTGSTIWAVSGSAVYRFTTAWTRMETGARVGLGDISASAPDNVWAAGWYEYEYFDLDSQVVRFDGTRWVDVPLPQPLSIVSIATLGPGDTWLSANEGMWHWNGATWTRSEEPGLAGVDLSVSPSGTVWTSSFRRYRAGVWSDVPAPSGASATSVSATSDRNVHYVRGDIGYHYDGVQTVTSELAQLIGRDVCCMRIFGAGSDAYVVGDYGLILRRRV